MSEVSITLPDGSSRRVPAGSTPADVAAGISPRLAKAAIAAVVDGRHGATRPIWKRNGDLVHAGAAGEAFSVNTVRLAASAKATAGHPNAAAALETPAVRRNFSEGGRFMQRRQPDTTSGDGRHGWTRTTDLLRVKQAL